MTCRNTVKIIEGGGEDLTRVDKRVEPLNVEERTFRMKVVQRVWVWGDAETSICTVPGVNRKGQATIP